MNPKPSFFKRLSYYIILLLLCFFLAEAILSIAFHFKYGNNRLALTDLIITIKSRLINPKLKTKEIEAQYHNQKLIRPDSSNEMNKQVVDDMAAANAFEFDPWLQFRNKDITAKYVNVNAFVRKSIPEFVNRGNDTFRIWFFGGSTMWGFNVSDEETIPSKFAQLYKKASKYNKTLHVTNYGTRSYISFQEMKLLQDRLLYEPYPDMTVFLDGLNDVVSFPTPLHREPLYTGYMREYFKGNFPMARGKNINDSIKKHYQKQPQLSHKDISTVLFNNYNIMENAVNQTAKAYGFTPLFIWQPVPYYNYSNQKNDPVCDKDSFPVYKFLNPAIEAKYKKMANSLYLADMLDGSIKLPFIDRVHYSPKMNEAIAQKILMSADSLLTH